MSNDIFRHLTALVNIELRKAHDANFPVTIRTNGYPIKLQENELAQMQIGLNDCKHEWVTLRYHKQWKPEEPVPTEFTEYTVCNLCAMTKPQA